MGPLAPPDCAGMLVAPPDVYPPGWADSGFRGMLLLFRQRVGTPWPWGSHGVCSMKPDGGHPAVPQRPLYPALQTLSPVLTPGSSGVPSHSLAGFPFLTPAQAGKS